MPRNPFTRLRLIDAEMVYAAGHGRLNFTLPYLRDYLRDHVATHLLGDGSTAYPSPLPPP